MGRGLSELQKTVLRLALANRVNENRSSESGGCDVLRAEVLNAYYGFDIAHTSLRLHDYETGGPRRTLGSWHFKKKWTENYEAAHAALCRALLRLEQREFIVRMYGASSHWAGANLTEAGIEEAEKLSVNSVVTVPQV